MKKRTFKINGMGCAACSARVEKAVSAISGVKECSVNLISATMHVVGDASSAEIISAVVDAGYEAIEENVEDERRGGMAQKTDAAPYRIASSIILLFSLCYVSMGHVMYRLPLPGMANNIIAIGLIEAIFSLGVLIINRNYFLNGFKAILHFSPNMDTLVALGSFISYAYSIFLLFKGTTPHEWYFESAAMIPTIVSIGKWLENRAKQHAANAVHGLMKLTPETALVKTNDSFVSVPTELLKVNDIFKITAGNRVPADGIVINGSATLDESMLTGESKAVIKSMGNQISAGTHVLSGELECQTTKVNNDTTLAKIIQLVENTSSSKAPIARFADKIAGYFVPTIIIISCITGITWFALGENLSFALSHAIAVLVVSCPCAMGLATPVAIITGSARGAQLGILFKTATALEMAGHITAVAFDKTGTITEGINQQKNTSEDIIRKESHETIEQLHSLDIKVVMISGDKTEITESIAQSVKIDEFYANVLPDGKSDIINHLQKQHKIAMVGDGINDAPALVKADLGMAIGAGTEIAIDAADVILIKNSLLDVVKAISLGREVLKNIKQNLFWAFAYNIIGIPLAAGIFMPIFNWQLTPVFSSIAMSISSCIVVLNALRLSKFK